MNLTIVNKDISDNAAIYLYLLNEGNGELLQKELKNKSYIKYDDKTFSLVLTSKGKALIKKFNVQSSVNVDIEEFTKKYRDLFKDENGKTYKPGVTGSKYACEERLKEFLNLYSYSKEHILGATKKYIESERQSGFKYLQKAHYVIKKKVDGVDESRLLTFCEELQEDSNEGRTMFDII